MQSHREELRDRILGTGLAASSGAACGTIVFTNEDAVRLAKEGQKVILCRRETSADDIAGLQAAEGVLTTHGGLTSHAAVVMRGMGKSAVTGIQYLVINQEQQTLSTRDDKFQLHMGEVITIDGTTGMVYVGEVPTTMVGHLDEFQTILNWADKYKTMNVLANADTPEDVRKAIALGAEGIGLCRTEHMFFHPDRINIFRKMILSEGKEERQRCLQQMLPYQRQDFLQIFREMHNRQVTIRYLDPPMHEFLPNPNQFDFDEQVERLSGELQMSPDTLRSRIFTLQESNPMLGCRGSRLEILYPEIVEMQSKAIMGAAIDAKQEGYRVHVQVMLPMIVSDHEVDTISPLIVQTMEEMCTSCDVLPEDIHCELGTMIETPRACIRADRIAAAKYVSFVSFGTNDLTQLIFGMSRDDTQQYMVSFLYFMHFKLTFHIFLSADVLGETLTCS